MGKQKGGITPNISSLGLSRERRSELVLHGISEEELLLCVQSGSWEVWHEGKHGVVRAFLKDSRRLTAQGRINGEAFEVWYFDAEVVQE